MNKKVIAGILTTTALITGGFMATDTDAGQVTAPESQFLKDTSTDSQVIDIPDDAVRIKVSLSKENWPIETGVIKVTSDYFDGTSWRLNSDAFGMTDDGTIAKDSDGVSILETYNESPLPPGTGRQIRLHINTKADLTSSLKVEFIKESLIQKTVSTLGIPRALADVGFVQAPATGGNCSGTSCTLAFGSNVTAGNLVTMECAAGSNQSPNASDTLGNTYTQAYTKTDTLDAGGIISGFYVLSSAGGADTVTCSVAASAPLRLTIQESSWGGSTGSLDTTSVSADGASATSMVVDSFTPSANGSALICSYRNPNGVTFTAGTNYTLRGVAPAAASSRLGSEIWYQATAAANTGPMTQSVNQSYAGGCMVFKPAAAAGGGTTVIPQELFIYSED